RRDRTDVRSAWRLHIMTRSLCRADVARRMFPMRFTMLARRPVLRALLAATAFAVPALSALAQARTSAAPPGASAGSPAGRRQIGSGSIGIALLVPPANGIYRRTGDALVEGVGAAHARDGAGIAVEIVAIE